MATHLTPHSRPNGVIHFSMPTTKSKMEKNLNYFFSGGVAFAEIALVSHIR